MKSWFFFISSILWLVALIRRCSLICFPTLTSTHFHSEFYCLCQILINRIKGIDQLGKHLNQVIITYLILSTMTVHAHRRDSADGESDHSSELGIPSIPATQLHFGPALFMLLMEFCLFKTFSVLREFRLLNCSRTYWPEIKRQMTESCAAYGLCISLLSHQ